MVYIVPLGTHKGLPICLVRTFALHLIEIHMKIIQDRVREIFDEIAVENILS